MNKKNLIKENILLTLAKMIAAFQIQRKIGDAMEKIPNDPDIKKAFKDLKDADERARRSLKNYCLRHPEDTERCKDSDRSK